MSECTDMRALRAEYDKIKQHAESVVSQNVELRQERDGLREQLEGWKKVAHEAEKVRDLALEAQQEATLARVKAEQERDGLREQLEAEVRAKESLGRMLEAERFEAAMRQHELASILADANAARERAELERDAARQEADTLRRQVRGMNDSAWVYEPIPAYMEQGAYFVIATTARLRFVAWIEGGAFVTRTGDGTLHRFDNVLCWIALPDLHNTAVAKREKYTELAEARQEIANLQRRAEHAAQELDDALDAVEAGTKERDEARQEADLLRRQVDAIVMLCVNDLDCGSCPVDSGICFDNPEICKKELAAWAALQAKEDGK